MLRKDLRTALFMSCLVLASCASVEQTGVVAVDSPATGAPSDEGNRPAARAGASMPPALQAIMAGVEQDLAAGQFRQAERGLQKLQRLAPGAPQVYLSWGRWALAQQQTRKAAQMFRRALSLSVPDTLLYREAQLALRAIEQ